ncbi:EAL domain-containing protein [Methylocystis echinoides]|uniref:Diguanylate cyclase n=1 Tax=Methylocystis echinoides TaxID=29468 RepID=A0A9W6GRH7_9HYPH|nr:EAL domain-containing protein [Methylocystis echinoides]GLI91679.1 diguanylate cyclase [Methylocystis echinoides]
MRLHSLLIALFALLVSTTAALSVESVRVPQGAHAIDLTHVVENHSSQSDRLQVSTAPGSDGIVRRIEVGAREAGSRPNWIVFALTNDTDEQIERLLVAPHFRLQGSGVIWPDLGSTRISAITASQGFPPEAEDSADADVFRLTLDPGTTVTYVAELRTPNLPQLYLWEPDAYKDKVTSLTLYKGIVIGIAGLLALFLTIVFVVKGAVIFPAAAALAWAVLAYVCIDFGFWDKIFGSDANTDRIWRAGSETVLSATLVVFLFAYLNLNRWHVRAWHVAALWLFILAALIGLAAFDAPVAAGVARISLAAIAVIGFVLVLYLASHGFERAIMLIPTWFLLVVWVATAGFAVAGWMTNDLVSPALVGGLVLIVMLIGFTVMQNAFATGGLSHGAISDVERKALAMTGANEIVFDWDVPADHIYVSPEAEAALGLDRGGLEGPASSWLDLLHPFEQDRYRACLDALLEQRRGRLNQEFRLRAADGHYLCYRLRARPVVGPDGEVIRVVGTLSDVTDERNAQERLLHDAVHDNLTGLPNRELFFDRLEAALILARMEKDVRPTVLVIDIDRFKQINEQVGVAMGDSILLTVAHRLTRLLQPQDTLARINGDAFAIILVSETHPDQVVTLADSVRRSLATPVRFTDREIALFASIGISLYDQQTHPGASDMLDDAEIAMRFAKRTGGNRIEVFRPSMRVQRSDRVTLEADMRRALERGEVKVFFQPIVRLEDRTIAGFESLLRWDHPRLGRLEPAQFLPVAEQTGLVIDFGLLALERTARELAAWQRALAVDPPIFASVNVSSRQLLRHDLLRDVKSVLLRHNVTKGSLKLEMSEALVMENPEYAAQMLARVKELGAGLVIDNFGAGYSSLAYLQRFPFDTIKIDRAFVKQSGKGARPVILRSLIALAQDLGMDVIAEGAETEADAIELYQLGCGYAQGYAFGRPISAQEARRLVGAAPEAAA